MLNRWVKVKKNSPTSFVDPFLSKAKRTLVIAVDERFHQVRVAHLINMWLPISDFEFVEGPAKTYAEEMR